jgi:hypothetical protein
VLLGWFALSARLRHAGMTVNVVVPDARRKRASTVACRGDVAITDTQSSECWNGRAAPVAS